MTKTLRWTRVFALAVLLVAIPAVAAAGPPQAAQKTDSGLAVKVGVGMGVTYGVVGLGIDIGIPYFSVVGGIGTALEGVGWGAGLRGYLCNRTRRFRPHLTAMYGTTMIVENLGYTVNGFAFYAGLDHDIGPLGGLVLTYGAGVLTNEPPGFGVEDPQASFKVMFGVNYRFRSRR